MAYKLLQDQPARNSNTAISVYTPKTNKYTHRYTRAPRAFRTEWGRGGVGVLVRSRVELAAAAVAAVTRDLSAADNDRDKSAEMSRREREAEINNNGQEPLVKLINYASHYVRIVSRAEQPNCVYVCV